MTKGKTLVYDGKHFITSDIRRSILECRAAYHEMTDQEFAIWYDRRYKIKEAVVMAVIIAEYREAST